MCLAGVLLVAFFIVERRVEHPLSERFTAAVVTG
jgi:hypothetical protein